MKNNKKLSDAIGRIDQKYIDEYVNGQKIRRPVVWRALIAAALAVALLAGAAIGLPALIKGNTEPGDGNPQLTSPEIDSPIFGVGEREYITDAAGNRVLRIKGTTQMPEDIAASFGFDQRQETAEMVFINWSDIIKNAKQSTSPDELIFIGTTVSQDVYVWDEEVTVNGEGWVVEYDVATGTTALKEMYECEPYQVIRRTMVQLSGIRIDAILKENNTTGYEVGDVIYFYSETARTVEQDQIGPNIPDGDMAYWEQPEIAIEPALPETAVESGAYIPTDTTTAAPPYMPSTQTSETEPAIEAVSTVPELDYNGDGKVDETDKAVEASTLPSSGQRMYVARVNSRQVSEIVKNSGIVPEQLWNSTYSCTAEEYRSGNFPNDMSNMP